MSIRFKTLAIVFLPIVLLGTTFVMYSRNASANYMRQRMDEVRKTVEFASEKVNKIIRQMERNTVDLANSGKILQTKGGDTDEIGAAIVVENFGSFPIAVGGGLWYEPDAFEPGFRRVCYYALRDARTGRVRLDPNFASEEYDYLTQNWYKEIAQAVSRPHMTAWSRPYFDDTGSSVLMTTVGVGIYNEAGRFVGMSTVDWELDRVVASLNDVKPTRNSFVVFSVPRDNYVISNTSNRENVGTGTLLTDIPWHGDIAPPSPGDTSVAPFSFAGVAYIAFRRMMDNEWMISVNVPRNEIFAELENGNRLFSILLISGSLVLLVLAWCLMSVLVNKPIARLIGDIKELGRGNLDARIEVRNNDEIGQLGAAFNDMTAELRETLDKNSRERSERERIANELNVATRIQTSMLPCTFPPFPERGEFEVYAIMRPAREVGGDFYDFFLVDDKTLAVVMADVSGKGVAAALFMVIARTLLKNNAQYGRNPAGVFTVVNRLLCENNEADMFVTAFMGYLEIATGKFTYVNAGHNPPLIRREGGEFSELPVKAALPLAVFDGTHYAQDSVRIEAGDVLFLYTDGVTEAHDSSRELFGVERFIASANRFRDVPLQELLAGVKGDIDLFAGGAEQADDITMLALRMTGLRESGVTKLILKAKSDSLFRAQAYIAEELRLGGVPEKTVNQINIAAEELFVNIANYAYGDSAGEAVVRAWTEGDEAVVSFSDRGMPFNPLERGDPDITAPLEERGVGGLGIFMARRIMDRLEYRREGDMNVVVARKRFETSAAPGSNGTGVNLP